MTNIFLLVAISLIFRTSAWIYTQWAVFFIGFKKDCKVIVEIVMLTNYLILEGNPMTQVEILPDMSQPSLISDGDG